MTTKLLHPMHQYGADSTGSPPAHTYLAPIRLWHHGSTTPRHRFSRLAAIGRPARGVVVQFWASATDNCAALPEEAPPSRRCARLPSDLTIAVFLAHLAGTGRASPLHSATSPAATPFSVATLHGPVRACVPRGAALLTTRCTVSTPPTAEVHAPCFTDVPRALAIRRSTEGRDGSHPALS